jgi:hypothetical protein
MVGCMKNMIKKGLLISLVLYSITASGQVDTLHFSADKSGKSYLSNVLINKETNIGVFDISYLKGRLSSSYYYVIDFEQRKIISTFKFSYWTYLHSSWFEGDSILNLSKGRIFSRKVLINLNTGEKIQSKKYRRKEKKSVSTKNNVYIDSQELYCTNGFVYINGLKINFDQKSNSFIINKEKN